MLQNSSISQITQISQLSESIDVDKNDINNSDIYINKNPDI